MPLGMEVCLGPGDFVLDGDPASPPKKGGGAFLPNFRPISIAAKRLDASRCHGTEIGLSPWDFVLDGDPAPPPKLGGAPKFSAHVYCAQTAGWIKVALGM